MKGLAKKLETVKGIIESQKKVAVAYSGGIASSILLKIADSVLGSNCLAVSVTSPFLSSHALEESNRIASSIGAKHSVRKMGKEIIHTISHNSKFRYYHYVREILFEVQKEAGVQGIGVTIVGQVHSETPDHSGFRKAISEFNVRSPFEEAGIEEHDLVPLGKLVGLELKSGPSTTFLASKIPYGVKITEKLLADLDKAEQLLFKHGVHHSKHFLSNSNTFVIEADHRDILHLIGHSDVVRKKMGKIFKHFEVKLEGFADI